MATKFKNLEAPLMSKSGLDRLLALLKDKLDAMDVNSTAIQQVNARIDTLIGQTQDGTVIDVTGAIDTFNEIRDFLAGISDTDLQSLLSAVDTAISTERSRAEGAESTLSGRVTTLENVDVMTANEVQAAWDAVFNPDDDI